MNTFLEILSDFLIKKYSHNLEKYCFIFPNRRSQLFFKSYLKKKTTKAGWMPEMYTISDFLSKLSGLQLADPMELSFEIYSAYCKHFENPESYDEFYPWGEMMIADFDDLDKYLVDPEQIFTNIIELKEIDTVFDYLSEDQKDLIKRFWQYFEGGKLSDHKESFLKIWKILFPVYKDFHFTLEQKDLAYEGMIYRKVAENLFTEDAAEIPWEKLILVGFNALSKSEQKLFDFLRDSGKGDFYWDYDLSYINNDSFESGRFLRKNLIRYPSDPAFNPGFNQLSEDRNLNVYNLPSDILQAKQLHSLLEEQDLTEINELNNTAIILGDESLLPAVLSSLPDNVENLNITMGYPVSQTPVYSFIDNILRLQQNYSRKRTNKKYYFRDVLKILNHQYMQSFYRTETESIVNDIHKFNRIYIPVEDFKDNLVLRNIFKRIDSVNSMMEYLMELLDSLLKLVPGKSAIDKIEKEYIYIIKTRLIKLFNLFSQNPLIDSLESFVRLFRKILSGYNIPFQGEPLKGVQIMGILESRLLDFKNVYILSLNEGVMPAPSISSSYVPANLRHAFEMPVREDKDAIYAYYFFRLMQRAEYVSLLYNSKTEGLANGEPSRYIFQMKYLMDKEMSFYTSAFNIQGDKENKIKIEKSTEVLKILSKYTDSDGKKYLSPSALLSFMDCSLRFYFTYVAGIREEDEASEEIDASGFGSLYHKTMELLYKDYEGEEITEDVIKGLKNKEVLKTKLDSAFRTEFLKSKDKNAKIKPEGRNIIIYEIILKMVGRTLDLDRKNTPFIYFKTEQELDVFTQPTIDMKAVHLGGKIDRIDRRKGNLHIIDYKTGKADLEFPSLEKILDRESWGSMNFKGIFQTFMYSWLYNSQFPGEASLTPGIYLTSKLFEDDFSSLLYDKSKKHSVINYFDYEKEFSEGLLELVSKIFDPTIDFTQTEDTKRCEWCSYSEICHK